MFWLGLVPARTSRFTGVGRQSKVRSLFVNDVTKSVDVFDVLDVELVVELKAAA